MSIPRLLDRQTELLAHMTSGAVIFDPPADNGGRPPPVGFDEGRLRLEAKFSFEKRIRKIRTVFARTWTYLGPREKELLRRFATECPPITISRVENARQFLEFLHREWCAASPDPAWLPDLARCELALADLRSRTTPDESVYRGVRPAARRTSGTELVMCRVNVAPLIAGCSAPGPGEACLVLSWPKEADEPRIFEVPDDARRFLAILDDWVPLRDLAGDPATWAMLKEFAAASLIEVVA